VRAAHIVEVNVDAVTVFRHLGGELGPSLSRVDLQRLCPDTRLPSELEILAVEDPSQSPKAG
jgi:hypothetical protein